MHRWVHVTYNIYYIFNSNEFSSPSMKSLKGEFYVFQNVVVGFMQKVILSKIYAIYVEHRN